MEKASSFVSPGSEPQIRIITAEERPFHVDVAEIWSYRALIPLLMRRDLVSEFSQTILGPVWFVIHPLVQSVIFALIFGNLAKISTDGATPFLFYNAAFVLWTYFTTTSTLIANVFINNAGLFGKVYFPRLIIPISVASFRLVNFVVNFTLFLGILGFFIYRGAPVMPNIWVLATPLLLIQVMAVAVGIGTLASSLTTRFRDMIQAVGYLFAVWMYATPIIYPLSQVPEKWQWLFLFNPMSSAIEIFRHAWLGSGSIDFTLWAVNGVTAIVLLYAGIIAFNYTDKTVVDTV